MSYVVVNDSGRKMLNDEWDTREQAEQAHLDLVYGAKLGNTKKGNDEALKYMKYKVAAKSGEFKEFVPKPLTTAKKIVIQYSAVKGGFTYKLMKNIQRSDYPKWENWQKDGRISDLEILDV